VTADAQKRHQCNIDLSTNTLRINNTEVPFLAEHELPEKARRMGQPEEDAATSGAVAGPSSTPAKTEFPGSGQSLGAKPAGSVPAPAAPAKAAAAQFPETHIETVSYHGHVPVSKADIQLTSFGVTREQAIQLLEAAGGNVDVAASMMFG
jgi:DNA damage-inducible protein 1